MGNATIDKVESMSYNQNILPTSLAMILNEITKTHLEKKRGVVRVLTAIIDVPFEDLLEKYRRSGIEIDCNEIADENGFKLLSCTAAKRVSPYDFLLSGNFHVLTKDFYIFFIIGEKGIFYKKIINQLIRKAYPRILRSNILTGEIFKLLEDFVNETNTELRYNDFWYKKLFGEAFTVKKHEKRLEFEDYEVFQDAFVEARDRGGWLDRITVFNKDFNFTIARNGMLKFKKGTFSDYYKYFFSKILDFVTSRWKIFEKKGRKEQPEREVKPILVKFESDVFSDAVLKKQFIRELSEYPNCSYSIIHGGNPHLYLSMLDRIDNSSFSIRTYGNNALLISPQIRTTKAALVRFSTYLISNFQEGKTVDFQA